MTFKIKGSYKLVNEGDIIKYTYKSTPFEYKVVEIINDGDNQISNNRIYTKIGEGSPSYFCDMDDIPNLLKCGTIIIIKQNQK